MATSADTSVLRCAKQSGIVTPGSLPSDINWRQVRLASESIQLTPNNQTSQELSGGRGTTDSIVGGAAGGGTVEGHLTASTVWEDWLASIFGAPWSGDSLNPPAAAIDSVRDLWMFQKEIQQGSAATIDYHRFLNTSISAVTIQVPNDGPVDTSWTIVGGQMDDSYTESPGVPVDVPPDPTIDLAPVMRQAEVSFTWGGDLAAAFNGVCHGDFSLTIDTQNRTQDCIGTLGSSDVTLGTLAVSGSAQVYYEDSEAVEAWRLQKTGSLVITIADTTPNPNKHTYTITLNRVKVTANPVPLEGLGTDVMNQLTFEAHEDPVQAQIVIDRATA